MVKEKLDFVIIHAPIPKINDCIQINITREFPQTDHVMDSIQSYLTTAGWPPLAATCKGVDFEILCLLVAWPPNSSSWVTRSM